MSVLPLDRTNPSPEKWLSHRHRGHAGSAIIRRPKGATVLLSNDDFLELQTTLGWSLVPDGVLAAFGDECRRRVACRQVLNAMHPFLLQCIFGHCAGHVSNAKKKANMPVSNSHADSNAWRLPKASASNGVAAAFRPTRLATSLAAGCPNCTASEALGAHPVLA